MRVLRLGGIVLVLGAVAWAALPFRISIPLLDGQEDVDASCRPAGLAVWHRGGERQLQLWAVTVGTDEIGYEVRGGQEPWCAEDARARLGVSAVLLAAGAALGLGGPRLLGRRLGTATGPARRDP